MSGIAEASPADLFREFLNEPSIAERVKFARATLDGRPTDEALSLLVSALSVAVDQLRAVSEIAISLGLSGNSIVEELGRKSERRSSDYLEYQFMRIVESLDDGTATS